MRNLLKERGYKVTQARLAILSLFAESKKPLDAKGVYKKLNNKNMNEVTVYRTLASFENSGILKKIDLRRSSVYFELKARHHHHMVCTSCDRVEDFENSEIEKILRRIVEKSSQIGHKFKRINEHSLELFGLCLKCA